MLDYLLAGLDSESTGESECTFTGKKLYYWHNIKKEKKTPGGAKWKRTSPRILKIEWWGVRGIPEGLICRWYVRIGSFFFVIFMSFAW